MSGQQRWNLRFAKRDTPGEAAFVLTENLHLLPSSGRALELACGLGANALLLAAQGLQVEAMDYSDVALDKLAGFARQRGVAVTTVQADLEAGFEPPAAYAVIVVSHYLYRPLLPVLVDMLAPGGLLFYQTFTRDKCSASGPSNPDYLLAPHELLRAFATLRCRYYREDRILPGSPACAGATPFHDLACFVGQKAAADQ